MRVAVMLQWSHQGRDLWTTPYATSLQAMGNMPGQGQAVIQWEMSMDSASDAAGQLSMFSSEERPVSRSASLAFARALLTIEGDSHSSFYKSLAAIGPHGWSGRTCPACCHPTADGTLAPSSEGWANAGMGSPTGFWTLSTSDWPSDGNVCSLSDILETGDVPQRYFLSAKACRGILRRAEKRGKKLPRHLEIALTAVAQTGQGEA